MHGEREREIERERERETFVSRDRPFRAALALYGLIVGMILAQSGQRKVVDA